MVASSLFSRGLAMVMALGFVLQPLALARAEVHEQADEIQSIEELDLQTPEEFSLEEASLLTSEESQQIAQDVIAEAQFPTAQSTPGKCMPDYKKWKKRLAWKVALTLPVTVAVGYVGGALIGGATIAIAKAAGHVYSSFEDLATFFAVFFAVAGATGVTGVGIEVTSVGKLIHTHQMIRLLEESTSTDEKVTAKWLEKLEHRYPEQKGRWTIASMKSLIAKLDQSGDMCNGTLKKKRPKRVKVAVRLKKRLAMPSDLLRWMAK
ncbi:MAG: hypothetical protein JNL01_16670 [Bdellovibrionales bacterium]|nr:hypothetical protein [Bdellovibrionales bacterium]